MPEIKSMTLEEAKAYKQELKDQGKTLSTSKEMGKVEDYIKTLEPEKYGDETVQSAYEKLSSGVTERGGWTEQNLSELRSRGIPTMLEPVGSERGSGDLAGYLSDFQDTAYASASSPELRESISAQIEPEMEAPEPIDYVEQYEDYREEYGVAELEGSLNDLKAQLREQEAIRRQRRQAAMDEPVAMGVIGGRVSEIERQEAERIDVINREMAYVNDQLTTAYGVIETYMNLEQMTYQDAYQAYQDEFKRNIQIYNLIDEEMDEQEKIARSNLQLYQNAIIGGNLDYDSLSSDQKALIGKLEVQSGLPIGFTASLKADNADGKVLSTTTRESGGQKFADVVMQMPDGTIKVIPQSLGAVSGDDDSDYSRQMNEMLDSKAGSDGYVSPSTWEQGLRAWVSETGGKQEEYVKRFASYVNPDHSHNYVGYDDVYGY